MKAKIIGAPYCEQYFGTEPTFAVKVRGLNNKYELYNNLDLPVDASIAKFICDLNNNGFITAACCSGLLIDHPEFSKKKKATAYIWFSDENTQSDKDIATEIMLKCGFLTQKDFFGEVLKKSTSFYIEAYDEQIKKAWDKAAKLFKEYYD